MRLRLSALFTAALLLVALSRAQQEPVAEIYFTGEPIGTEAAVAQSLHVDAVDVVLGHSDLAPLDLDATTLQRGLIVRAYAEAHAMQEDSDPVVVARSHARRALILARLGTVNFAAEHANLALRQPAARGEVMLARAWMLWHAGDAEGADRAAALATGAPAWALAEWKTHRVKYAAAFAKFTSSPEPEDPYGPAFLTHAELAVAARAFFLADGLYFRAVNNLQQQLAAEPNFPPINLQRARRGLRDFLRATLGDITREPDTMRLSGVMLAAARDVCTTPATKADWENYLQLIASIRQHQSRFEFASFDLHGDFARCEKETDLAPVWRERLKPLLDHPRQRFASRLQQTLARLEDDRAPTLLDEPLNATFTAEQLASLKSFRDLVEPEDAILGRLRDAIPADSSPVPGDAEFVLMVAKLRYRLALADRDVAAARTQIATLEKFRHTHGVELERYHAQLEKLERSPFLDAYAKLLRFPATDVPEKYLDEALDAAGAVDEQLTERHGEAYFFAPDLPAESIALVQRLCHLRIVNALSTGNLLSAELALADLELWCVPKKHPAFEPLAELITAVTDAPSQEEPLTAEEQEIWNSLKSGRSDPSFPVKLRAAIKDDELRWTPHLLLPIAHWRLGQDDLARAAIAQTKELVRRNRASRTALDTIVANNDPGAIVHRLIAGLQQAPAREKTAKAAAARKDLDALLGNLAVYFSGGQSLEFSKLPLNGARVYALCVAGYIHCHLAEGRLSDAVDLLGTLESLKQAEALALAQPAVENFAFTNDLPDEAARATWRRLLNPGSIANDQISAALQQLKPASDAGSVSASMISVLGPYRAGSYQQARANLAKLQRLYGRIRAISAQLQQLSYVLNYTTSESSSGLDFDESIDSLIERRRNLRLTASNYKDANFDALADAFNRGLYTQPRRYLEALCQDIDAITAQIAAVEARQNARRNEARQRQESVREEAYATLRRLMAL